MIIEQLTLRNWRGYREPHSFRFKNGFNLVVGRNEAGKSTMFEALTRVMIDRHSSKAEEIRRIQPLNSSLGPEVELIFQANGHRYKICKRFLQHPMSKLFTERTNQWDLDHEGDKADNELLQILHGDLPSRAAQPEHRGLAQALWYLQKEDPIPKRTWAEGIKQGLAGIIEFIAKNPEEDAIFEIIDEFHNTHFTPQTAKIKSTSEISTLSEQIETMENQLRELRAKSISIENFRVELEEFEEGRKEKERSLQVTQTELTELQQALDAAEVFEEKKQQKEATVGKSETTLLSLSTDLETIDRRIKKIKELKKELEDAQKQSHSLQTDARLEQLSEEGHHNKWKFEYEPILKKVEEELVIGAAIQNLAHLTKEKLTIASYLSTVQEVEGNYRDKKRELVELNAPTKKEWTDFNEAYTQFQTLEAQAKVTAIRIKFDLEKKEPIIITEPDTSPTENEYEYLVLTPTIFTIGDLGRIHVRGGGSSLEELNEQSTAIRTTITDSLERFHADDKQSLSDLYQNRIDLEKEIKDLKKRLDELHQEGVGKEPNEDLARVEREIREESEKIQSAPFERKAITGKQLREKIDEITQTKKRLIADIDIEQIRENEAKSCYQKNMKNAIEAGSAVERKRSQITSLETENGESLIKYGSRDNLIALVSKANEELQAVKKELASIMHDYEKVVERPKKEYATCDAKLQTLKKQRETIEQNITDRKARIEEYAAQGLYSQVADLEATLKSKKRYLEGVQRNAEAIKLLHDMVLTLRKEQSAILAGPVSELVNKWLGMLTDDAYDFLDLNDELLPVAIRSTRFGERLPLESISYGTYEQVVVLLRLALGTILSSKERNLVIIDDRLVNADPVRMKRLSLILQEVADKSCQIVVATCNDTPYAGIKGNLIRVPMDGKISNSLESSAK